MNKFGIFFLIILSIFATTVMAGINSGLVAYWSFDDGTATDNSGNGHDGTVTGATTVTGMVGQALHFDGQSFVQVPDDASLQLTTQASFAFWMKQDAMTQNYGNVFSKGAIQGVRYSDYAFILTPANDHWFETTNGNDHHFEQFPVTYDFGTDWHCVVIVYNQGDVTVYIDGSQYTSGSMTLQQLSTSASDFFIGNRYIHSTPLDYYFEGSLDEFRIYDRILSRGEIIEMCGGGQAVPLSSTTGKVILVLLLSAVGATLFILRKF